MKKKLYKLIMINKIYYQKKKKSRSSLKANQKLLKNYNNKNYLKKK